MACLATLGVCTNCTGRAVHQGANLALPVVDCHCVQEGVERVKEHLLSAAGEAACCMICLESIRPADPVWSCQAGCYAVMHLPCIQASGCMRWHECLGRPFGVPVGLRRCGSQGPRHVQACSHGSG